MPEELYNSHDYCTLAEELEKLKLENEELIADKIDLCKALEADYAISNRELLILQVEISRLNAELARLTAELSMQKSLVAAREQDLNELYVELAALKSEIVSKDKKVTDYEIELRQLHKYDKTCSTCRYLDENQNCVLGIRCVNYTLWQGRIL